MIPSSLRYTLNHEHLSSGDTVVGQYTENGRKMKNGASPDDEETIQKQREMMQRSASAVGGTLLAPEKSKTKTAKTKSSVKPKKTGNSLEPLTPLLTAVELATEKLAPVPIKPVVRKTIYLHNKLGKVKMKINEMLDSKMAFGLVFENEDDIVLEPNPGEVLTFIDIFQKENQVYYPDVLFTLANGNKLMILFKNTEDQQTEEDLNQEQGIFS